MNIYDTLQKASRLSSGLMEYVSGSLRSDTLFCVSFYTNNWGDAFNKWVLGRVTNRNVLIIHINYLPVLKELGSLFPTRPVCTAIGSIMHYVPNGAFVWGTGCVYHENNFSIKPSKVLSVRGPLTAMVLASKGFERPDLYGDPALLLKKYLGEFSLSYNKRYLVGVIPHHAEKALPVLASLRNLDDVLVIDIEEQQELLFDKISQCKFVLSSSLHGLILCDILDVPNLWVRFRLDFPGDNFKFNDYYSSLTGSNEYYREPYPFYDKDCMTFGDLKALGGKARVHEGSINLDDLEGVLNEHLDENF